MDSEVTVRLGVSTDVDSLIEFNRSMALETEGIELDPLELAKGVSSVFEDERKGYYVVAESENRQIVGGLLIVYEWSDWRNAWFWWITSVFIIPDYRGKGIYRRLYEFVKQEARKEGNVHGFRLYVDIENTAAQQVYEKVGMFASQYMLFGESLEQDQT
ncbi:MAG: GNAT family N-acetyltransferase [Pyrinomonadaceae bacterium]|nr:GNAT family N-acetyltransferase [Pyrinomonadaceae bacterium]